MYDVVALGELLIDFTNGSVDEKGYPTLSAHPGGAPANFLAALAKYGMKTALLGKVGNDVFGRLLIKTVKEADIETGGIIISDDFFTTLAFVTLDERGEREFSFARKPGADMMLTPADINIDVINAAKIFHFGTLSLTNEPARSATHIAVEYADECGKQISFDPNFRRPLWSDLEDAKKQILWGLEKANIVKISDDEIRLLWDIGPEEGAAKIRKEFGTELVFVTCGSEGCVFANKNSMGKVGCPKVTPVDTTGAGDIFGGSALSRILKSGKRLEAFTYEDLYATAEFACTAASLSTEHFGGISSVPDEKEVYERIR